MCAHHTHTPLHLSFHPAHARNRTHRTTDEKSGTETFAISSEEKRINEKNTFFKKKEKKEKEKREKTQTSK